MVNGCIKLHGEENKQLILNISLNVAKTLVYIKGSSEIIPDDLNLIGVTTGLLSVLQYKKLLSPTTLALFWDNSIIAKC